VIQRALFVCTGNIFRSLTAHRALAGLLADRPDIAIASAGTVDYPHVVWPYVGGYLRKKGFDVSDHRRRTLTQAIVDESDLVVAMSTDHQACIRERFGREAPLFLEVCGHGSEWLPDIHEVVQDWERNQAGTEAHIRATIDRIVELASRMAVNIDALMAQYGKALTKGDAP
jgi:protein-tyrosine phosphatase